MPGDPGVTVVTCLRAFYFCTQGCGRIGRPAFPAPSGLHEGRDDFEQNSGASCRENAESHVELERRHCERGEAIHSCFLAASWIASRRSQ